MAITISIKIGETVTWNVHKDFKVETAWTLLGVWYMCSLLLNIVKGRIYNWWIKNILIIVLCSCKNKLFYIYNNLCWDISLCVHWWFIFLIKELRVAQVSQNCHNCLVDCFDWRTWSERKKHLKNFFLWSFLYIVYMYIICCCCCCLDIFLGFWLIKMGVLHVQSLVY